MAYKLRKNRIIAVLFIFFNYYCNSEIGLNLNNNESKNRIIEIEDETRDETKDEINITKKQTKNFENYLSKRVKNIKSKINTINAENLHKNKKVKNPVIIKTENKNLIIPIKETNDQKKLDQPEIKKSNLAGNKNYKPELDIKKKKKSSHKISKKKIKKNCNNTIIIKKANSAKKNNNFKKKFLKLFNSKKVKNELEKSKYNDSNSTKLITEKGDVVYLPKNQLSSKKGFRMGCATIGGFISFAAGFTISIMGFPFIGMFFTFAGLIILFSRNAAETYYYKKNCKINKAFNTKSNNKNNFSEKNKKKSQKNNPKYKKKSIFFG